MEPRDVGTAQPAPAPVRPGPGPVPGPPPRPVAAAPVAAALEELAGVAARPLTEHPDAFARVHAGLQQALADIDDA